MMSNKKNIELRQRIVDKMNDGRDYKTPYIWSTIPQGLKDFWIEYFKNENLCMCQ